MKSIKKNILHYYPFIFLRNAIYSLKMKRFLSDFMGEINLINLRKKFSTTKKIIKKSILFYPCLPFYGYSLYQIARILRLKIISDPCGEFHLAIDWRDQTVRETIPELNKLSKKVKVLNINCKDISKVSVEAAFKRVYGYDTFINPCEYEGEVAKKSNKNATHNGIIIRCPIDIKEVDSNFVYQKLINNTISDKVAVDLRTYIIGNRIPIVQKRYRDNSSRFDDIIKTETCKAQDIFSEIEIGKILEFCRTMGLDYGELDVLRDNENRIYIIDVNTTPYGGHFFLDEKAWSEILMTLADAFYEEFINA